MRDRYCYWSVCVGPYKELMEQCLRSARAAGVFKEFHLLCDEVLSDGICYDACDLDKADGLFKLHYLKAGMSLLNFDYFIWIDADTVFQRNPLDPLVVMRKSPLHVPLEPADEAARNGSDLAERFRAKGVLNDVYSSRSSFWIVHHDAIEVVYDLALGFWREAKNEGVTVNVDAALGYAMHLLCADVSGHRQDCHPEVWEDRSKAPNVACESENAAIVHLGNSGNALESLVPGEGRGAL